MDDFCMRLWLDENVCVAKTLACLASKFLWGHGSINIKEPFCAWATRSRLRASSGSCCANLEDNVTDKSPTRCLILSGPPGLLYFYILCETRLAPWPSCLAILLPWFIISQCFIMTYMHARDYSLWMFINRFLYIHNDILTSYRPVQWTPLSRYLEGGI